MLRQSLVFPCHFFVASAFLFRSTSPLRLCSLKCGPPEKESEFPQTERVQQSITTETVHRALFLGPDIATPAFQRKRTTENCPVLLSHKHTSTTCVPPLHTTRSTVLLEPPVIQQSLQQSCIARRSHDPSASQLFCSLTDRSIVCKTVLTLFESFVLTPLPRRAKILKTSLARLTGSVYQKDDVTLLCTSLPRVLKQNF